MYIRPPRRQTYSINSRNLYLDPSYNSIPNYLFEPSEFDIEEDLSMPVNITRRIDYSNLDNDVITPYRQGWTVSDNSQPEITPTNPEYMDLYHWQSPEVTDTKNKNKKFDLAGALKGASSIATAAATDIFDIINSTKSNVDPHQYNYDPRFANSMHELSTYSPTFQSAESLHKPTFGEAFIDINMRTGRGAMAGLSLGPWGALGGAIGGTLSGVTNSIVKAATYNKDRRRNKFLNNNLMDSYDIGFKDAFSKNNLAMRDYTNYNRSKNQFDQGGQMNTMKDVSTIDAGGSHEANPYGGVPMGIGSNGKQNLVEEGEVIWKGYVFPKRQIPDTDILKKFNTNFKKKFISYADAAQFIIDLHKEQSNNAYDQQTFEVEMTRLRQAKEYQDLAEEAAQYGMTPEEYLIALQQQQEQAMNQQAAAQNQNMMNQPLYANAMTQNNTDFMADSNMFAQGGSLGDDPKKKPKIMTPEEQAAYRKQYEEENYIVPGRTLWQRFSDKVTENPLSLPQETINLIIDAIDEYDPVLANNLRGLNDAETTTAIMFMLGNRGAAASKLNTLHGVAGRVLRGSRWLGNSTTRAKINQAVANRMNNAQRGQMNSQSYRYNTTRGGHIDNTKSASEKEAVFQKNAADYPQPKPIKQTTTKIGSNNTASTTTTTTPKPATTPTPTPTSNKSTWQPSIPPQTNREMYKRALADFGKKAGIGAGALTLLVGSGALVHQGIQGNDRINDVANPNSGVFSSDEAARQLSQNSRDLFNKAGVTPEQYIQDLQMGSGESVNKLTEYAQKNNLYPQMMQAIQELNTLDSIINENVFNQQSNKQQSTGTVTQPTDTTANKQTTGAGIMQNQYYNSLPFRSPFDAITNTVNSTTKSTTPVNISNQSTKKTEPAKSLSRSERVDRIFANQGIDPQTVPQVYKNSIASALPSSKYADRDDSWFYNMATKGSFEGVAIPDNTYFSGFREALQAVNKATALEDPNAPVSKSSTGRSGVGIPGYINTPYYGTNTGNSRLKYYDYRTGEYVSPTDENRDYLIEVNTSRHGRNYDGIVNDAEGSAFANLISKFSDDDLNRFANELGMSREEMNRQLTDTLFGPVHKRILNKLYNELSNAPADEEIPSGEAEPAVIDEGTKAQPVEEIANPEEKSNGDEEQTNDWWTGINPLRFAPVFDNLRSILEQNQPDYTYANRLGSLYQPVETQFIGQPMSYTPLDQYNLMNRANQAANTMIGSYRNSALTPAGNSYLASVANQNYQQGLANNYIQGMQYNDAKQAAALQFNNNLLFANEQNRLGVETGNRALRTDLYSRKFAAENEENLAVEQAIEANKAELANKLGLIGREISDYEHVARNPMLFYGPWANYYKPNKDK